MNKTFLTGVQTIQMYQKIPEVQYLFSLKILKLLEENELEELDNILNMVLSLCSDQIVDGEEVPEETEPVDAEEASEPEA